ncbi:hypothetical protein, partial [Yersinia thracica]|uniref:hypothetical protein n=1 Tax=Yersinia thracica TaxID=2890319 RepID=UPI001C2DF4CF
MKFSAIEILFPIYKLQNASARKSSDINIQTIIRPSSLIRVEFEWKISGLVIISLLIMNVYAITSTAQQIRYEIK